MDIFEASKARYHFQILLGADGHGWVHPLLLLWLVQVADKPAEG